MDILEEGEGQENVGQVPELPNETGQDDQRIQYSRWQCTENTHTKRLRLQRVKSGVPQEESAVETVDHLLILKTRRSHQDRKRM